MYGLICFSFLFFYYDIPRKNRYYFQSAYTAFEYSVFSFIFWYNIAHKKIRKAIGFLSIGFFLFIAIYLLTNTTQRRLDSVPIGIETILIILYIIYYLYEFSKKLSEFYIYNHYAFWISVGILIYLGGSFFFYILINHLDEEQVTLFGNLTYMAEILKNVLFSLALVIYARKIGNEITKKPQSLPYLDMI